MVFQTEPHIQRARVHIQSGNADQLPYACLELRYALERIAYQKLQLRLDKITADEIGAWQPGRAMDRLMDLVDEHLAKDSVLSIAPQATSNEAATGGFSTLGQNKGISPREIGKHWQKLGSFLHIRMPRKKGEHVVPADPNALVKYLEEVITYIEEITRTSFDSHFSRTVTFKCGKCAESIVRNGDLLKEEDIVQCQNPNCTASYIAHIKDREISFETYQITLDCKACGTPAQIEANAFTQMKTDEAKIFVCDKCGERHVVRWLLQYGRETSIDKQD